MNTLLVFGLPIAGGYAITRGRLVLGGVLIAAAMLAAFNEGVKKDHKARK